MSLHARMYTCRNIPNLFMTVIILKLHKVAAEKITIQSKLSFIHSVYITSA
jgi:hypothetical protein